MAKTLWERNSSSGNSLGNLSEVLHPEGPRHKTLAPGSKPWPESGRTGAKGGREDRLTRGRVGLGTECCGEKQDGQGSRGDLHGVGQQRV